MTVARSTMQVGDIVERRVEGTIHGDPVPIPDPDRLVHLQFRRYAGCPVCNLHLRSIMARHKEIQARGISEVVVFHSTAAKVLEYQGDFPFAAIADPKRRLYQEFGVERMTLEGALRALPEALFSIDSWRSLRRAVAQAPSLRGAIGSGEDKLGLPADFLIGPDGTIKAVHYGENVDDQWSVDELLDLASESLCPTGEMVFDTCTDQIS